MKRWSLIVLFAALACQPPEASDGSRAPASVEPATLRIALFNIRELKTGKLLARDEAGRGSDPQAMAAAAVVKRLRPDVLVINEIDHDYRLEQEEGSAPEELALNARRFAEGYLAADGEDDLEYPFAYAAPNNTGFLTGLDLNGDGHLATDADRGERRHGDDCYGWGTYPGEYSMAVLSRYPLAGERARTFQRFLWKDLPGHHIPPGLYSPEALELLRLSSKSHWDLPVEIGGRTLHLFLSHPTPTVFDGEEDRNGRRNFDEIKFWVDYLDGSEALYDDTGRTGGFGSADPFVILGDLNARPDEEISRYDGKVSIDQLLGHPRIADSGAWMTSEGALTAGEEAAAPGPPGYLERSTAPFGGGMRIDYILPSTDLEILDGGVFWPAAERDPEGARLADEASDHRFVWLDLRLSGE